MFKAEQGQKQGERDRGRWELRGYGAYISRYRIQLRRVNLPRCIRTFSVLLKCATDRLCYVMHPESSLASSSGKASGRSVVEWRLPLCRSLCPSHLVYTPIRFVVLGYGTYRRFKCRRRRCCYYSILSRGRRHPPITPQSARPFEQIIVSGLF